MASLKFYVDNLSNTLSGLLPSDDSLLVDPQLQYWFNQYRSKLIYQFTDYGKQIHSELYQDLGAWEVEQVDKAEDPALKWGGTILRFKNPIPEMIQFPMNRGMWIGGLGKQTPFVWTTVENAIYKPQNRFAKNAGVKWVYLIGQTPYILDCCTNDTDLKWVNLRGVLTDPTKGNYYYSNGSGIAFNRETSTYPMNMGFADLITKSIIQTEFNISSQTKDNSNDGADNIVTPKREGI